MKMKTILLTTTALFAASALSAQIFWNPSQDAYDTVGGDGTWYRASTTTGSVPNWWNGTDNVFMSDNQNVVFEGAGTVGTAGPPRPGTVTFRNLTGNYSVGRTWLNGNAVTVESTAGNNNVTINRLDISALRPAPSQTTRVARSKSLGSTGNWGEVIAPLRLPVQEPPASPVKSNTAPTSTTMPKWS